MTKQKMKTDPYSVYVFALGFCSAMILTLVILAFAVKYAKPKQQAITVSIEKLGHGKWKTVYWGQELPLVQNAETQRTFTYYGHEYRLRFE